MFWGNFIIALREGVEASLLVGILVAYVVKIGRRDVLPKLWLGVILAALIPLGAGAYMTWGTYTLTMQAQEILGGSLSLLAAVFVTWMMLWMSSHSRELAGNLTADAAKALENNSAWAFVWLAVLAVGREGIETAVFIMGTVDSSANTSTYAPLLGMLAGLAVAVLIGWIIYSGAARFNLHLFFSITGFFLIFVAAGIAAYGIHDLQEAGVLPGLTNTVYRLSPYFDGSVFPWLTANSTWFNLLSAMFNVQLDPTWLEFLMWWAYVLTVLPIFIYVQFIRPKKIAKARATSQAQLALAQAKANPGNPRQVPATAKAMTT
ncbi:iron transporter [Boudabousia tangfeifanii]|uniref:Iron transporter n=1 Tax=Boudabousia tangfeifanii TaxID=1912795 RepID=A0A1D9MLN4_9ACTO|nr:iron uptake transporter permease EfeU [Boudabousia tangfeifanii]AOZ73214.1 iron transporter [Boudabousia tangfeifanii]